jgi:CDP-diacylglycerol pyrophosphatase
LQILAGIGNDRRIMVRHFRLYALLALALGALAIVLAVHVARADADGRDALRRIVQQQCVEHWLHQRETAPCEAVTLPAAPALAGGYAVLADRKGGAHFLLIPTDSIIGIESPALARPDAPNYLADAWDARRNLESRLGHAVDWDLVGLAVNPRYARSQDQLHIHIECLGPQAHGALRAATDTLPARWTALQIGRWRYQARRLRGRGLQGVNPFAVLAADRPSPERSVGDYTLLVAGANFRDGPGFVLLAGSGVPGGESLLDPACALARSGP